MKKITTLIIFICLLNIPVVGQKYFFRKYDKPSNIVKNTARKEANYWLSNCADTLHLPKKLKLGKLMFGVDGNTWDLIDSLSHRVINMNDTEKQNTCKLIENLQLYHYIVKLKTKDRNYLEVIVFYFNGHGNLELVYNSKDRVKSISDPVYSHWYKPDCSER